MRSGLWRKLLTGGLGFLQSGLLVCRLAGGVRDLLSLDQVEVRQSFGRYFDRCSPSNQQVLDQLWVRNQWFSMCVDGVSAVVNLSQCFKIAQQYITQPLGINTWNLPLLGLLIFKPAGFFTDEDCVTATQISSVSGTSQVGHQLQVISVSIHKTCH